MAGSADYSIKPGLSYRPQTEPELRARPPPQEGGGFKVSKVQLATAATPAVHHPTNRQQQREMGGGQKQREKGSRERPAARNRSSLRAIPEE